MSKQDRQGVRTFEQLMRRFNLDGIDENVVTEMFKQISQVNEHLTSLSTTVTQKLNILLSSNQTWFYGGVPTMESYPAAEWTDTTQKDSHIGDFYYDTDNEKVYIFTRCDGIYEWKSCFSGGCDIDHDAIRQEGYDEGYAEGQRDAPDMLEHALYVELPSLNIFGKPTVELNLSENLKTLSLFASPKSESDKNITVEHLIINSLGLPTSMSGFMQCVVTTRDEKLKTLTLNVDTQNVISFNNAFNGLKALETIDGIPLDCSSATVTAMFTYCNSLKEVRFKENTIEKSISFSQSPDLSATSIQSIVDGLATITTAQTLTLNANQNVLQSQIDSANAKGWTVVGGKVVEGDW